MRAIEERTFREIGEALDRAPATVQGLYARAVAALKEELDVG